MTERGSETCVSSSSERGQWTQHRGQCDAFPDPGVILECGVVHAAPLESREKFGIPVPRRNPPQDAAHTILMPRRSRPVYRDW